MFSGWGIMAYQDYRLVGNELGYCLGQLYLFIYLRHETPLATDTDIKLG